MKRLALCLLALSVCAWWLAPPLARTVGQQSPAAARQGTATGLPPASNPRWANPRTLTDHYEGHGRDVGATGPEDYARKAQAFYEEGRRLGFPAKVDSRGTIRMYDPATNRFGAFNAAGSTRTFFAPSGRNYFNNQPGELVSGARR